LKIREPHSSLEISIGKLATNAAKASPSNRGTN
jgi:hypothetical protein